MNAAFAAAADSFWEQSAARRLILHVGGNTTYRVKFYASTPREELLAGIREVLGVRPGTPLRFRDADGDIVVLAASMPDSTHLHVTVEVGAAASLGVQAVAAAAILAPAAVAALAPAAAGAIAAPPDAALAAAAPVAADAPPAAAAAVAAGLAAEALGGAGTGAPGVAAAVGGAIAGDGDAWQRWTTWFSDAGEPTEVVVTDTRFQIQKYNCRPFWAFGDVIPAEGGPYYGTIEFTDSLPCCMFIGVVPADQASMSTGGTDEEFMMELQTVGLRGIRHGSRMEPGATVGIYADPAKKQVVIVNHNTPRTGTARFDDVPFPVKLALRGNKHEVDAAWTREPMPVVGIDNSDAALLANRDAQLDAAEEAAAAAAAAAAASAAAAAAEEGEEDNVGDEGEGEEDEVGSDENDSGGNASHGALQLP